MVGNKLITTYTTEFAKHGNDSYVYCILSQIGKFSIPKATASCHFCLKIVVYNELLSFTAVQASVMFIYKNYPT